MKTILELFRSGMDTFDIAKLRGMGEAEASRTVWIQRCREKNLPQEYLSKAREARHWPTPAVGVHHVP